jgi:hypothetical protein
VSGEGKSKNRKAVFKDSLGARMMIGQQPAVGLFVLVAPVPAAPAKAGEDGGQAKPAESKPAESKPQGQAPAAPPPKFTLCFVDGQGYLLTVSPDENPWTHIESQLDKMAKLRAPAWAKAKKKQTDMEPIFAAIPSKNPHYHKLTEDAEYQLCLVSHPNPAVALAVQTFLNEDKKGSGEAKKEAKEDEPKKKPLIPLPAKKESIVLTAKVVTDDDPGGKVAHIDLPTDSASYWPPGHTRYGGWVLYQDMPYAYLKSVRKATTLLASDLASLRYPTGEAGDRPYPGESSGDAEHSGGFGTTLMATVHAFQLDAAAGNGVKLLCPGSSDSWSYLLVEPKPKKEKAAPSESAVPTAPAVPKLPEVDAITAAAASISKPAKPGKDDKKAGKKADKRAERLAARIAAAESNEDLADSKRVVEARVEPLHTEEKLGVGVVTAKVGDAIAKWQEKGYRKNGAILVRTTLSEKCWARPELATSLAMWDLMAKALGCPYGIQLLCTFRELTVPAGVGRVECSNHKLGLSTDLHFRGYRDTPQGWPVHYEANWVESDSSALREADKAIDEAAKKVRAAEAKQATKQAYLDKLDAKAKVKPLHSGERETAESALQQAKEDVEKANQVLEKEKQLSAERRAAAGPAKSYYQLLWRIYGHSSFKLWNPPGKPGEDFVPISAAELQALLAKPESLGVEKDGPWGIETKMAKLLRKCFPDEVDATAQAAVDAIVAKGQAKARQVAAALYEKAGRSDAKGLIASFFRREIAPFIYNPMEADGGTSAPLQTTKTDAKLMASSVANKEQMECYLNLTRLGYECEMSRIPAQRGASTGTFKKPDQDPEFRPNAAPSDVTFYLLPEADEEDPKKKKERKEKDIAVMLRFLLRIMDDMSKATGAGKPRVVLQDGKDQEAELGDIDSAFIREYAELLDKPKSSLTFQDIALQVAMSGSDPLFDARVKPLEPELGRTFLLLEAGRLLDMDADKGRVMTLKEWIKTIKMKKSKLDIPKDVRSTEKALPDWSLFLFPVFGAGTLAGKPLGAVILPPFGQPAPLEWWHYDRKAKPGSWGDLAEAIGYSGVVVRGTEGPPAKIEAGQCQGGLGFKPEKIGRVKEPTMTPPENLSDIPEGG